MSNIYEKLIEERNRIKKEYPIAFELEALSQLMLIAFTNNSKPDELPETFFIEDVLLSKNMLESLLKRININADVEFIKYVDLGATFKIMQK